MTDSKVMEGIWWLPETPDLRVAGSLAITATGAAELSLIGSLSSFLDAGVKHVEGDTTTISFTESSLARSGRYRRILGLAGHEHITLENCLQAHRGGIFGGIESERIHVGLVFVGLHFEVGEETRFTAVHAHMDHLIDWLQLSGLEESFDPAALAGKGRVAEVGLSRVPEKRVRLDDEAVLKVGQTFRVAGDLIRLRSIKQDFYLSIEYKTLETLDTLLARLRDFQDLVTIGTDRVAGYAEVSVNHPDIFRELPSRRVPLPIEVHADWHAKTAGELKAIYPEKMLFTFTEFGGLAGLRRWAEVAERNRATLSRLMATKYAPSMFLSDRVMNVAAAIEGYDREKYHDRKTYLARLTRCAAYAGDPFVSLVGDVDAWCKLLKEARNDIAHDNARLDTTSANHLVLSYSSYFLLALCLLRDAGAGPAVFRRIQAQSRFRWVGAQTRAVMDGAADEP